MARQQPHPAALDEAALLALCQVRRQKRSGPGGQHRNKVETAIVICHQPSGIKGEAAERRSQEQNYRMALRRLRTKLAVHVRLPLPLEPSACWKARTSGGRLVLSKDHEDFPALLAEAIDTVNAHDYDVKAGAQWLGVTVTQLTRLLKCASPAIQLVNDHRRVRGLRPLK